MTRRAWLVKPDPTLTEPCARPDCGHPEGQHLICGCQDCLRLRPDGCCPVFALPTPECPHCKQLFDAVWKFDAHIRFRTPACLAAERQHERDAAAKQRAREHRTRTAASQ